MSNWSLFAICLIIFGTWLILRPEQVPSELPLQPAAGLFMTSDKSQISFYITRLVDKDTVEGDGVGGVCIIQPQFPQGFFENCVVTDAFLDVMKGLEGRITKEAKYAY